MASENPRKKERVEHDAEKAPNLLKLVAVGAGIVAAACLLVFGLAKLGSGSSSFDDVEKLMKAPGRKGEYISRNNFEIDPKAYFTRLRQQKK